MIVLLEGVRPSAMRPDGERFSEALLGMRVPPEVVERMVVVVEFRGMIPPAGFLGRRGFVAKIIVRSDHLGDREKLNRAVAHELKHLSFSIRRCSNRQQKWDEVDCERAEKRWGKFEFFGFSEPPE